MQRIPNLETAIDECKRIGRKFNYEVCNNAHLKFYIEGCAKCMIISRKNENPDKVKKDIKRLLTA